MGSDRIFPTIVGIVAVLLDLLLTPALTFGDVTPGFIVAAAIAYIVLFPDEPHYVFAFVMGLLADLIGSAPVGATSISLLVVAFLLPPMVEAFGSANFLMMLIVFLVASYAAELLFSILLSISGAFAFPDALVHVCLPCGFCNAILAFLVFIACSRFTRRNRGSIGSATMSNIRFSR